MTKVQHDTVEALEERMQMIEQDITGLKSQFKLHSNIGSRMTALQNDINEIAYDLNNKIASIRGMLARTEQLGKTGRTTSGNTPYDIDFVETDPAEEAMLDSLGIKGKARDQWYAWKALQEKLKGKAAAVVDGGGDIQHGNEAIHSQRRYRRASEFKQKGSTKSNDAPVPGAHNQHAHTPVQEDDTESSTHSSK